MFEEVTLTESLIYTDHAMTAEAGLRKLQAAILESEKPARTPDCPSASRWISVYGKRDSAAAWTQEEALHISSCDACLNIRAAYEVSQAPPPSWWRQLMQARRVKLIAVALVFAIIPALMTWTFADLRTDYAENLTHRTAAMHDDIVRVGGIIGALVAVLWYTAREHDWLAGPMLSLCLGAASVGGATVYTQETVREYAATELIHREELFQSTRWVLYDSVFFWPNDPAAVEATGHPGQQPTIE
ncbi:MAG: hypothetical protein KDA89_20985 [Planctomycetaceae bacterium]|nr:hypothetical protein [Planctomycetaceae bacterium]